MKENAGLAHLGAGTLEGLVFLELVGASLEDPGKDGSVVHPARHGYEVGHEVEWECQIGESACEERESGFGNALVLARHGI